MCSQKRSPNALIAKRRVRTISGMKSIARAWVAASCAVALACAGCGSSQHGQPGKGPPPKIDVNAPDEPSPFVIILEPGAREGAPVASSPVTLAGLVGNIDTLTNLTWESDRGDAGSLALGEQWQSDPIELPAGDTRFTVHGGLDDGSEVSDSITLTLNPGIAFTAPFFVDPPEAFAGETVDVTFSVGVAPAVPVDAVNVVRVDEAGEPLEQVATLASSGDVWTGTASLGQDEPGPISLRAEVTAGGQMAESEVAKFTTYARPSSAQVTRAHDLLVEAGQRYEEWQKEGFSKQEVRQKLADLLNEQQDIVALDPGPRGDLFVWKMDSGLVSLYSLAPDGTRAHPTVGASKARFNESFGYQWITEHAELADTIGPTVLAQECPMYALESNTAAEVQDYAELDGNGLVLASSHGDAGELNGEPFEAFYTEEPTVKDAHLLERTAGELVMGNAPTATGKTSIFLGVTNRYIYAHNHHLADAIVVGAACRSAYNGSMAKAFFALGAKAYLGTTGYVSWGWGADVPRTFFDWLMNGYSVADAHAGANSENGPTDPMYQSRYKLLTSTSDLRATGKCKGQTTFKYLFQAPSGTIEVSATSIDKVSHRSGLNELVMRDRQITCTDKELSSDGSAGVNGSGTTIESYESEEEVVKIISYPGLFVVNPELNNPDWMNYQSFSAFGSDQYAGDCPWSDDGFVDISIRPGEMTGTGIKIERAVGSAATFDSGTLKVEIDFTDQFIQ